VSKFTCPCCGYRTLDEKPPGTCGICPICYWEDDPVQYDDPDYEGGANAVSLRQAQQNFLRSGVSDERFRRHARKPTAHDEKDPYWSPLP
jgi:rubredoxin